MAKALCLSYTSFVVALSGGSFRTGESLRNRYYLYYARNLACMVRVISYVRFVLETRLLIS